MLTLGDGGVRIASCERGSGATDIAARDALAGLDPATLAGAIAFCGDRAALEAVAREAAIQAPGLPVIGCTTAGEITPWGQRQDSVTLVGFAASDFAAATLCFDGLPDFDPFAAHRTVAELIGEAEANSRYLGDCRERAALLLIDGLSCREELPAHTMRHLLDDIPMIGGSAGDGMAFRQTWLLHRGEVRTDRAVLMLLTSRRPLRVFRADHHEAGAGLAVITRADPATRRVHELNGEPAAQEYARLAGDLSAAAFAAHPMMVRVGGNYHARAPIQAEGDGTLVFQSAIEHGLVLRLGHAGDMVASLDAALESCGESCGEIEAVIAFESAQNRMGAEMSGQSSALAALYERHRFVGFHTYGEQYRDVHLNRALVGLAIGKAPC